MDRRFRDFLEIRHTSTDLSVPQRMGNAVMSAVEGSIAYAAISHEVAPTTGGDLLRNLTLSAVAGLTAYGSLSNLKSAITGRGVPAINIDIQRN